jgi:hypothetical protein
MFSSGFSESKSTGNLNILKAKNSYAFPEFGDSDEEGDDDMDMPRFDRGSLRSVLSSSYEFPSAESATPDEELKVDREAAAGDTSKPDGSQVMADRSAASSPLFVTPNAHGSETSADPVHDDSTTVPRYVSVINDVAYTTYYAILYYIYTDNIVFAPLSSSFALRNSSPPLSPLPADVGLKRGAIQETFSSRKEWIKDWIRNNPGRPAPCSAKAAYRIADKLDLRELKERAAQHIFKSLTVDNIAYEVFSPFAAAFEEIRKVQINFFLTNWGDIRASESMRNVWQQLRSGRHAGFEGVWPVIASSLEFKPKPSDNATSR